MYDFCVSKQYKNNLPRCHVLRLYYNFFHAGSKVGKLTSITLDCDMSKTVCELIPDTNATIKIDFTVG